MVSMAFWFGFRTMFSVYLVTLVNEFGWGRGETAGAQSIAMICYILSAPLVGGLVDRFGPRRVIVPGVILLAAGMALSGSIHRLLEFYIYFGLMAGVGVTFISLAAYTAVIPHWFEKRRGTASGIAASGMGLGILVFVPLSQGLISSWGWRSSFLILGIATAVILLPLNGLLLRHKPSDMGYAGPDGRISTDPDPVKNDGMELVSSRPAFDWGVADAMKTLNFWSLMAFPMFSMVSVYIVSVHFVGFLIVHGVDKMVAASTFALVNQPA